MNPLRIRKCQSCGNVFIAGWPSSKQKFCGQECKGIGVCKSPEEAFRSNFKESGGCWEWQGSTTTKGYGRFKFRKKTFAAHRFALSLALGRSLKDGEQANHGCDNRKCVRVGPGHIFLGTQKDNIADAMSKSRMICQTPDFHKAKRILRGEQHPRATINDKIVREIRSLRLQGLTQQAIADRFGILQLTVSLVLRKKIWAHVV